MKTELRATVNSSERRAAGKLHVLTLTPFYPSAADDGNGCFVSEPLERVTQLGVGNTVMAVQPFYRRKNESGSGVCEERMRYFSLPGGVGLAAAGAFVFARIVPGLRKLHRARPVDLIHAHGALPCGHAAMLASRELNIPFVVSVHGLDAFSTVQVGGRFGEWCRKISRSVYRAASRVICVSEHVRDAVLEGMNDCQTTVVYNGVDPDRFSPSTGAPSDGSKILAVGNLIPVKGHETLIRAVSSLAKEFPGIELDIIGEGGEQGRLEALVKKLNVADKVHFGGRQSRARVAGAMRNCTIFALPSRYEGLGCVYLEAMSCGKPAIGCRGQGIAEIIQEGKNGFLIDANDDRGLAGLLGTLVRHPEQCERIGRMARDTVLHGFTLEHQARSLFRIYEECRL